MLTLKTGQNEAMDATEAETFVNHLMKTYDKNHDGRFDYAGMIAKKSRYTFCRKLQLF